MVTGADAPLIALIAWIAFCFGVAAERAGLLRWLRPGRVRFRTNTYTPPAYMPPPVDADGWRLAWLAFGVRAALYPRPSERTMIAHVTAGDYRKLAPLMFRAGLWRHMGPRRAPKWTDAHPLRAVGRARDAEGRGRIRLPYPDGPPPMVL